MLCNKETFFDDLVLDIRRFSRLCLQIRFIMKRQETDLKTFYLNLGSDKIAGLSGFLNFSEVNKKRYFLGKGKKKCRQFFKKETNLLIKHLWPLVQS